MKRFNLVFILIPTLSLFLSLPAFTYPFPRRSWPGLLFRPVLGQQLYYPYYGKNKINYEDFKWKVYKTDNFIIYFYVNELDLVSTLATAAERAYFRVSEILKHKLSQPTPLIYYRTYTDFEQTNLFQVSEGVLGVSEPVLHRIALHGDMPSDELLDLVVHELTHIFQFDLLWGRPLAPIYTVIQPPLWVFEGLSEYLTGRWSPWSALIVRDAVLNDRIPELTENGELLSRYPLPRDPAYDFGHALYEFIEHRFGRSGIREFWSSLKNLPAVAISRPEITKRSFNLKTKEFNQAFKRYLRERTKPFLTRENPEDYSITLGPEFPMNPYYFAFSHALSPSGDIAATITYNAKDEDIDIVLISTKDGRVLKNITKGYTSRYEYIRFEVDPSAGPGLAWSPDGDYLAFFGRDGRRYSLFIVNAFKGNTLKKIAIPYDQPASPCFDPNGKSLLFTAFERGWRDIFRLDLNSGELVNLTQDAHYEKAPSISPDGQWLAFTLREDGFDHIYIAPLHNLRERRQLTSGSWNAITPVFSPQGDKIYFAGDQREAYNLYVYDLKTSTMHRLTDVRTGNFFPYPIKNDPKKLVFASFNKGSFQLFKSEFALGSEESPSGKNRQSAQDEGPPRLMASLFEEESLVQKEAAIRVEIDPTKIQPYEGLEKLVLTERPPIDAAVSTDGSVYGGSVITLSDMLADHTFLFMATQVRSFRSYFIGYLNQKRRLQFLTMAYDYTEYYYTPYDYLDPSLYYYDYLTYQDAMATRQITAAEFAGYYPLNRYHRLEFSLGAYHFEENYLDPFTLRFFSPGVYGLFWNGNLLQASLSLIGETTFFKAYGPASGYTYRFTLNQALPISSAFFSHTTIQADLRKYFYLGEDIIIALRWEGFMSRGRDPWVFYYGGNNQVRSANFYNLIATEGWYFNAELRFPLINAASTILGQIGPVRGVFFFDLTRSKVKGFPAKFYRYEGDYFSPIIYEFEAIGSYGYGFQFFLLGLPIHLEFAKRLEFPSIRRPFDFSTYGSFETKLWIGFDF
ncbi:MAG: DPP IV N-terminal domain-containing protein [Candidatus Aminicenantes bacterium]|nr:DPP IV N-terminal domain-containing protein [Candidatus Aminicenantes bacterium]